MQALEIAQFIGPLGGLLCVAWAMGALSGYAFHAKTVLKYHEAIAALKEEHCLKELQVLREQNKVQEDRIIKLEAALGIYEIK